jgi:tripartite-type tricarboxylate transporter receptor subunit TctC
LSEHAHGRREEDMKIRNALLAVTGLVLLGAFAGPALSQQPLELKIMAPANPGGGWDQTARSMQQALVAAGIARSAQVTNVGGAGARSASRSSSTPRRATVAS